MNGLMQNNQHSMTSQQIAELVGTRHSLVKQSIERLVARASISQPPLVNGIKSANGVVPTHYVFSGERGKRDSYVVVAQLSPEFTAALVDRWQELEAQASQPVMPALPQSFAEALQLAADQARQLELAAPKVAHYDKVVDRHTLLNATQVGQKVGLSAVKLNRVLDELKVYNQAVKRSRVFNSWFMQQGLGELKQTSEGHTQALFSLKGEAWIIERPASEGVIC